MKNDSPFLSVIIPAYNESDIIGISLEKMKKYLDGKHFKFEIIVVDDGSKDETAVVVEKLKKHDSRIKFFKNTANKGKGYAARKGVSEAKGRYIFLTDADLQICIEELDKFLRFLNKGFDIVIASRALPGARLMGTQSKMRIFARFILSCMVKLLIASNITDAQCGFKCFTHSAAHKVFKKQTINGFGFDLEVLFIARKQGYKIKELPVKWVTSKETKVRLAPDGIGVLKDIVKIKIRSLMKKY